MGEVKEEAGLNTGTWSSASPHGGALDPHKGPPSPADSPPDAWTVAAAALTVAGAAISICLSAPTLYKAGRSWWTRLF
jgi:hypothetical protein